VLVERACLQLITKVRHLTAIASQRLIEITPRSSNSSRGAVVNAGSLARKPVPGELRWHC
jgi:hypothetical protein